MSRLEFVEPKERKRRDRPADPDKKRRRRHSSDRQRSHSRQRKDSAAASPGRSSSPPTSTEPGTSKDSVLGRVFNSDIDMQSETGTHGQSAVTSSASSHAGFGYAGERKTYQSRIAGPSPNSPQQLRGESAQILSIPSDSMAPDKRSSRSHIREGASSNSPHTRGTRRVIPVMPQHLSSGPPSASDSSTTSSHERPRRRSRDRVKTPDARRASIPEPSITGSPIPEAIQKPEPSHGQHIPTPRYSDPFTSPETEFNPYLPDSYS